MVASPAWKIWKKQYDVEHKDMINANRRVQRKDNPKVKATNRKSYIKTRYGISVEDYDRMVKEQKGLCAVCLTPLDFSGKNPDVDHSHATNKVRGIVHPVCNKVLGLLKDDPVLFRLAAEYLERHKES